MILYELSVRDWWEDLKNTFTLNFITDDRYMYLVRGLGVTFAVTLGATVLGVFIGVIVALIRSSYDKNINEMRPGIEKGILIIFNRIAKIYLAIIRGTPMVVQLMIAYFVIFVSVSQNKILVAILAFGFNSGAYVAEIIRSGIMSIDPGQFEAGRSLGFTYDQTMFFIIIPQAFLRTNSSSLSRRRQSQAISAFRTSPREATSSDQEHLRHLCRSSRLPSSTSSSLCSSRSSWEYSKGG